MLIIPKTWLSRYRELLRRSIAAVDAIDGGKVPTDIRARTRDRQIAERYVRNLPRLLVELEVARTDEREFCRSLGRGHSYAMMHRRMQLLPDENWARYLKRRREIGDNGVFGLPYAVYLALGERGTSSQPLRTQSADGSIPESVRLITNDALSELRSMQSELVDCCVTSPPYWPARRLYVPGDFNQIGFEPTLEEYFDHVVRGIFRELKRVLKHDGTCWVVIDDSISDYSKRYPLQSYERRSVDTKRLARTNFVTQNTTYLSRKGNWLGIPWLFSNAMVADGWYFRDCIIWDKGAQGRKESSDNRCRHNYEYVLMFAKTPGYHYIQDTLRRPLAQPVTSASVLGRARYSKEGVIRADIGQPDWRILSNPLGCVADAVWHIPAVGYRGAHCAAFPEELVRRCLLLSCRPNSSEVRPMIIDPFSGSGTSVITAWKMGYQGIGIDRNSEFTEEAKQRLLEAKPDTELWANDNEPPAVVAGR